MITIWSYYSLSRHIYFESDTSMKSLRKNVKVIKSEEQMKNPLLYEFRTKTTNSVVKKILFHETYITKYTIL